MGGCCASFSALIEGLRLLVRAPTFPTGVVIKRRRDRSSHLLAPTIAHSDFPFFFPSPRGFKATTCMAFPLRWVVAELPMKRRMPSRRLPLMFVSGRRGVSVALQTSEPTNRIAASRLALPCASWSLTPRNAQWRTATRRESSFDVLSLRGGAPTTGIVRRGRAEPTPSP